MKIGNFFFVYLNANTNSLYCALFTYAKWTFFCSRLCDGNFYANFELTFILFFLFHTHIYFRAWMVFLKRTWEKNFASSSFFSYEFRNVNLLWLQQSPGEKKIIRTCNTYKKKRFFLSHHRWNFVRKRMIQKETLNYFCIFCINFTRFHLKK